VKISNKTWFSCGCFPSRWAMQGVQGNDERQVETHYRWKTYSKNLDLHWAFNGSVHHVDV